ncbi:hypothetical protein [Micromonospora musae]|uniref:hypothetical protein n=1 Tax=Micromonospora musae TaxID=1894970 RepID=UPI0011C4254C|nr:hypothetical protein [Micromonospora musae]
MTANPFVVPQRGWDDRRPLCPWKHAEHNAYYVPVDHTEEAFRDFCNKVGDPATSVNRSTMIVAVGGEGCGKTALLHRCAHWLDAELRSCKIDSVIVDLTDETGLGLASDARLVHWTERLVDRIAIKNVLKSTLQKELSDRKSDPRSALPLLGDLLENIPKVLHVILPGIEFLAEATVLASLARPYLNLYTECTSEDLRRSLRMPGTPGLDSVVELEVGVLSVEDGWVFVQSRLAAAALAATAPTIDEATVRRYMEERIKGRGTTTIRELNLICAAVFADAQGNSRPAIEFSDFSAYYLRNGVL